MDNKQTEGNNEDHQDTSADRNRENEVFLNESWDNIAEVAQKEDFPLNELEKEPPTDLDNPPFQLVTKNKKLKNKTITSKTKYQTRSKVPNPKPFK